MSRDPQAWYDDAAGPLVRPYAVTRGRTRAVAHGLSLITLLLTVEPTADVSRLAPECAQILALCRQPQSVAEISARLKLPVAVVKVLVSDLLDAQHLISRSTAWRPEDPDRDILQAVIDGLRQL